MVATKLELALRYARMGAGVFPLAAGSKVPPEGSHGHLDASTDEAAIRRWFTDNPSMNWGAAAGAQHINPTTGEVEHLELVDLDRKKGKDGIKFLDALCKGKGVEIPNTLSIETPTSGLHLLYWVPGLRRKHGADILGPGSGVDLPNYVVGPGSTIGGNPYRIVQDLPIASCGPAFAELFPVADAAPSKPPNRDPLEGVDSNRSTSRALAYLKTVPGAKLGSRGSTAYKVAARLKDLGCSEDEALLLMDSAWNHKCEPPMPDEDLATSVTHAYRYGKEPQGCAAPEAIFSPVPDPEPSLSAKPPRFLEVLRWSDLKDHPIPPIKWLLEPFFPAAPFGILASAPGHGKSILALQLAVALATGLPVLDRPACGPAGAGILAMEDGEPTLHRRLDAIRRSYGFAWQPEHDALLEANLRLLIRGKETIGDPAHLGALAKQLVEEMKTTQDRPAALFLDTLNSVYAHDENDNTAARLLAATVFRLHDALDGCSVWALHHIRKAGVGRNAPSMADRVDPELVRGASALAASARAMVQLGWVTPNEAQKVGLDPENANRRYGILALSKINDGPLSQWVLTEHDADHAGLWTPAPDGEHLLAALRGGNAAKEMDRNERILLDLASGMDREKLQNKYFPEDPRAMDKFRGALRNIRTRQEWIQKGSLALTEKGRLKVQELERAQASGSEHPELEE